MTLDLAIAELARRRAEMADAEADGSWDAFANMKRAWGFRRKRELRMSRAKLKAWLAIAKQHAEAVNGP